MRSRRSRPILQRTTARSPRSSVSFALARATTRSWHCACASSRRRSAALFPTTGTSALANSAARRKRSRAAPSRARARSSSSTSTRGATTTSATRRAASLWARPSPGQSRPTRDSKPPSRLPSGCCGQARALPTSTPPQGRPRPSRARRTRTTLVTDSASAYPEPPFIVPGSDDVIRVGDVVAIEPGHYVPGVGGMRLEDVFLVTDAGPHPTKRLSAPSNNLYLVAGARRGSVGRRPTGSGALDSLLEMRFTARLSGHQMIKPGVGKDGGHMTNDDVRRRAGCDVHEARSLAPRRCASPSHSASVQLRTAGVRRARGGRRHQDADVAGLRRPEGDEAVPEGARPVVPCHLHRQSRRHPGEGDAGSERLQPHHLLRGLPRALQAAEYPLADRPGEGSESQEELLAVQEQEVVDVRRQALGCAVDMGELDAQLQPGQDGGSRRSGPICSTRSSRARSRFSTTRTAQ